jgi:hypothetical protein
MRVLPKANRLQAKRTGRSVDQRGLVSGVSGRWIIAAMVALALALTAFSWLYWYSIGNRAKAYWGTNTALLIAHAERAEALLLGQDDPNSAADEVLLINDCKLPVEARHNLMQPPARGWNHVRTLLLRDAAYEWDEPARSCQPRWRYALRLWQGSDETILLISTDCPRIVPASGMRLRLADGTIRSKRFFYAAARQSMVSIRPISRGLGEFLQEQFLDR